MKSIFRYLIFAVMFPIALPAWLLGILFAIIRSAFIGGIEIHEDLRDALANQIYRKKESK